MGKKKHKKNGKAKDGLAYLGLAEAAGYLPPGLAQMLAKGKDKGMLNGLLGSRKTEQFVLGAVIGAAAVYVLGNEELRAKLIKSGMRLYSGITGGLEEMKEQVADIRAEMAADEDGFA
jgi:hypothetical protein